VLCSFRDITEQKRAEAALRSSLERFSIAFERSASGIAMGDIRDTRILKANPALCEMLGYPENELRGLSAMELTHPDDRAASQAQLDRLQSGSVKQTRLEKRYLHKDGHAVWTLVIVAVVQDVPARTRITSPRSTISVISSGPKRPSRSLTNACGFCSISLRMPIFWWTARAS
jgi:PAS domain S-box-containing protein